MIKLKHSLPPPAKRSRVRRRTLQNQKESLDPLLRPTSPMTYPALTCAHSTIFGHNSVL